MLQGHRGGPPQLGSYSVVQCISHLKEHLGGVLLCSSVPQAFDGPASLLFSCQLMLACGERAAVVMAPPPTRDSAISPCFHGCPAFLRSCFPPQSPPSPPPNPSLHSQQQPSPCDPSILPKLQLPAAAPSRGPSSLSGVCMATARTV